MLINAILNGREVRIVNITRQGSTTYVQAIDGLTSAGTLTSFQFSTSAFNVPTVVLSTSAISVE